MTKMEFPWFMRDGNRKGFEWECSEIGVVLKRQFDVELITCNLKKIQRESLARKQITFNNENRVKFQTDLKEIIKKTRIL
jgi:hypothetical protein